MIKNEERVFYGTTKVEADSKFGCSSVDFNRAVQLQHDIKESFLEAENVGFITTAREFYLQDLKLGNTF